ncbi:calcium-binding protein [Pseudomonas sp. SCA2728.1_7]|uniref:beta strand repeat-containing protein n=2 Tax=Pseudomonas TaxID=286 RepID=UPI001BB039CA|nr:calcium-binding protein [Pseudomonas sp. SCA2728.1_7]QUE90045.1 calcium-binding protein [Pseudomonas sp. SCA2728.1_7]
MAVINGTSGTDTLVGTSSADELYGFAGNDSLSGGEGNDLLDGGAGADVLNGGNGIDTASYANSTAGVTVNLVSGTGIGGDAQGDTLTSIETVVGSAFNDNLTASLAGNSLIGGAGNDVYFVNGSAVNVIETAGGGDDEVRTVVTNLRLADNVERLTYVGNSSFVGFGNGLDNVITGGANNDTLSGGAGADQFIGGAGTDTVSYIDSPGSITINTKTGVHTGIAEGDTYVGIEVIQGSNSDDIFISGAAADTFDGSMGNNDTVDYSGSASGVTASLLSGAVGVGGDAQGDRLWNIETVIGSSFDDSLTASLAGNKLIGGAGNDVYFVNGSAVNVIETAGGGDDEVRTVVTNLRLADNVERLTYVGNSSFVGCGNGLDNVITGGANNDTLSGGAGADQFIGGAGTDTVSYIDSPGSITINTKTGVHTGIAEGDTFVGIEVIQGSNSDDIFISGAAADTFDGSMGNNDTVDYSGSASGVTASLLSGAVGVGGDAQGDRLWNIETVIGSSFGDSLTASLAGNKLIGGAGNDVYFVNGSAVNVIETAGGGDDEVRTVVTNLRLADNVERLTYVGNSSFVGFGNGLDNVITGGANNDTLSGGAGADQFIGGAGTDTVSYIDSPGSITINTKTGVHTGIAEGDTYVGIEVIQGSNSDDIFISGAAADTFDGSMGNNDTVDYSGSASGVTASLLSGAVGVGGDAQGDRLWNIETVIGSSFDDSLTASLAGNKLIGGAGNDVYFVNGSAVNVIETAGGGDDEVRTVVTNLRLADNVERLTYVGNSSFVGFGNGLDNVITGGANNDTLSGGAGADQFIGGAGTDTVSYIDSPGSITINTKTGVHTGIAEGDTFVGIEVIQGSNSDDIFISGAAADTFDGSMGNNDTVDYSGSASGVTASLLSGAVGVGGDAQGDRLWNIETVIGSSFDDSLTASLAGNKLIGGAGNDVYFVNGSAVNVIETAGGGDDEVRTVVTNLRLADNVERLTYVGNSSFVGFGNGLDNVITGGANNDTLSGGAGADQFIGGAGTDTVSYIDSPGSITINTKTGVHTGIAEGDTFVGIEVIQGSNSDDIFISGAAADTFDGSMGNNDTVDYSGSASGVTASLLSGAVGVGGDAQGDRLWNIETVIGSSFDDSLTASLAGNKLIGGAGNDVYFVNGSAVNVIETAGGGDDEVRTVVTNLRLADNVERLTYVGNSSFVGFGNGLDNVITGGANNDVLSGGAGADQFIGGNGFDVASYIDSPTGVTINTKTGVNSGIALGDTYVGIEQIRGSNSGDIFVGGLGADNFDGSGGTDILSFASETSGVTLDLSPTVLTGIAAGDAYTSIEAFQGTSYADTFTGSARAAESFIGGGGADTLTGVGRGDGAWYVNSSDAVQINLLTGSISGGDAQGDVLINIDNLIGSAFNDTLTGNTYANVLEGGDGNDVLYGGDGNDTLYGHSFTDISALAVAVSTQNQSDTIYGGNGDDYIMGYARDVGSVFYGEAGNDNITVFSGIANGGDGNDTLTGSGHGYELHGGAGADKLYLNASGDAYGGEGSDAYFVSSKTMVAISDDGTAGIDIVTLKNIQSFNDVRIMTNDQGVYIFNAADVQSGNLDSGLFLKDWNKGANTIETFYTNNGDSFTIPVVGQAMAESLMS